MIKSQQVLLAKSYLETQYRTQLKAFGYLNVENSQGLLIYHPDSFFFIRVNQDAIGFGFAIRQMVDIEDVKKDLWKIPLVDSWVGNTNKGFAEFIRDMLIDYEDYVFSIPLRLKVKKHFHKYIKSKEMSIKEVYEDIAFGEVQLIHSEIVIKISRNYWTRKFYILIEPSRNIKATTIGEAAKSLGINEPLVDIRSQRQSSYLKFTQQVVEKLLKMSRANRSDGVG